MIIITENRLTDRWLHRSECSVPEVIVNPLGPACQVQGSTLRATLRLVYVKPRRGLLVHHGLSGTTSRIITVLQGMVLYGPFLLTIPWR